MASNLDPVFAEVSVAGKAVHFTYLKLEQSFNAHHHCEIHTDCEEFGLWMDEPVDIINYIGENVNIIFKLSRETSHGFVYGFAFAASCAGSGE
ncbi:hypothetical protein FACS1894177_00950 [Bacteroidia bacterium]|nr:hypothetical protein FACS1894177_00950 [Bacteroidia bacterium]